tara:strand:+ start:421 stop:2181 length:1761 start_codon:yes stop_codon:yes gene_type:complete
MPLQYYSCPAANTAKRRIKDTHGVGRTWHPGSYGRGNWNSTVYGNNNPNEASQGCPPGYTVYPGSVLRVYDEEAPISLVSTSRDTNSYVEGGYWGAVSEGRRWRWHPYLVNRVGGGNCGRGLDSDGRGYMECDRGHGHGGKLYVDSSNESRGNDDYAAVCMKNADLYYKTRPTDGFPWDGKGFTAAQGYPMNASQKEQRGDGMGGNIKWPVTGGTEGAVQEDVDTATLHKELCCGLRDKGKNSANQDWEIHEEYCHPDYCMNTSNTNWSQGCGRELANWCEKDDNFQDIRCKSEGAKKMAEALLSGRTRAQALAEAAQGRTDTMSLTDSNYASIGNIYCDKDSFGDETKKNSCIDWCSFNKSECDSQITEYCREIYYGISEEGRAAGTPSTYGDIESSGYDVARTAAMEANDELCACNWPDEYYDNVKHNLMNFYKVSESQLAGGRKCLYKPCETHKIQYVNDIIDDCPADNYLHCIQEMPITVGATRVDSQGELNITPTQNMDCSIEARTEIDSTEIANQVHNEKNQRIDVINEEHNTYAGIELTDTQAIIILVVIILFFGLMFFLIFSGGGNDDSGGDGDGDDY